MTRIAVRPAAGFAAVALALLLTPGCGSSAASSPNSSSSASKSAKRGFVTLEATVTEREHEMPGSGGAGYGGTGNYYLGFEARDGEATAHYRFPVTKSQYDRYPEGAHVQIVIGDNQLRDIRPLQ